MAYQLILIPIFCMLLAAFGLVIAETAHSTWAWLEFRRQTKGLPMISERSIICNHTLSWCLRKDVCNDLLAYFERSRLKTVGWLMGTQFAASTVDLNLMKRIVLDKPNENINKARIKAPLAEYLEDSIMLAEDEQWYRLRRALAPALRSSKFKTPNVIRELEESIGKLIEAIDDRLAQAPNGTEDGITIEADDLLHRYSLDQVFSSFFKQPHLIDFKSEECTWTRLVEEGFAAIQKEPLVRLSVAITPLKRLADWLIWNFHRQGRWRRKILQFVKSQTVIALEARKQLNRLKSSGTKFDENDFLLPDKSRFRRNMIDHFTDHFLDGKLTKEEYFHSASFMLGAADTTVVEVLVTVLYELSINREVQEKVREAIKKEGGAECEYLGWVIDESLRLLPPVPVACSRKITKDIQIQGGHILPAGTFVLFPNYVVHRMEEYWGSDASEFKPERFASANKFHPMQFVPFGAGVRICPGKEFALFQMRRVLAKLLLRYKFECRAKEDAYKFDAPFLVFITRNSPTYITVKRLE